MFVRLFAIKQIHEKTNDSMAIRGCLFGLLRAAVITTCWSSGCRSEMLLFQPQCIVPVDNTPPSPCINPTPPPEKVFHNRYIFYDILPDNNNHRKRVESINFIYLVISTFCFVFETKSATKALVK